MEGLTSNIFFLVILLLCVVMHLFGHGGHDNHSDTGRGEGDAPRPNQTNRHRH